MSGDHNEYQKTKSYLNDDFECPRCGHCCQALETEQEPVLWLKTWSDGSVGVLKIKSHLFADHELEPLYTAPPKKEWVGLTNEEVSEIIDREIGFYGCWGPEEAFARAIEGKLKEKNRG